MIGDHREQRIEEIISRVTGGYRRQIQVDLQDYPRPHSDKVERVAAAIRNEMFVRDAYTEYGTDDEPGQWERVDGHINLTALADAVIRELEADVMADDYVPPCCRPGGRCNR